MTRSGLRVGARRGAVAFALIVLGAGAARPLFQQPAQRASALVSSRVQYIGSARLLVAGRADSARVDIRTWSIAGGQRIGALELPLRGLMIVEVRGGEITTVINGRRQARTAGEIFSVPAGSTMGLATGNDMATVQTTVIGD